MKFALDIVIATIWFYVSAYLVANIVSVPEVWPHLPRWFVVSTQFLLIVLIISIFFVIAEHARRTNEISTSDE